MVFNAATWQVLLLPYLEEQGQWQQAVAAWAVSPRAFDVPPHQGYVTPITAYICPADRRLTAANFDPAGRLGAFSSYVGVRGSGRSHGEATEDGTLGLMSRIGVNVAEITDGASHTIMAAERPPPDSFQAGRWYSNATAWGWPYLPGPDSGMLALEPRSRGEPCVGPFYFSRGRTDNPCDRFHFWSTHQGGSYFLFGDRSVRFLGYSAAPLVPELATRAGSELFVLD